MYHLRTSKTPNKFNENEQEGESSQNNNIFSSLDSNIDYVLNSPLMVSTPLTLPSTITQSPVSANNIPLAEERLSQQVIEDFTQHRESMIAEMQKNPAHACIWAQAYISTKSFFMNVPNLSYQMIIESKFFNDNLSVMGKYYNVYKLAKPEAPVAINENLRIRITQLLVLDKGFADAIRSMPNEGDLEMFAGIVNTRYPEAFKASSPCAADEPAAKKAKRGFNT